jgi:outer membrane protein assembly factor BamB/DNA-binding MarR family transcriptional regulator
MAPLSIFLENGLVVTGQNASGDNGPVGLAPSAWPMLGQNPRHTSLSGYNTNSIPGEIKWEYPLNSSGYGPWDSAVIGADGTIYIGFRNYLYAFSPFGNLKWRFNATNDITSTPAINAKGDIIFATMGSSIKGSLIYSVNSRGNLVWTYDSGTYSESSPAIGTDGTIYIGTYDNNLIAINPDGTLKWSIHIKHGMWVSPAIGLDGTIYMSSLAEINPGGMPTEPKSYLVALKPDGTEKWRYSYLEHDLLHTPSIGSDDSIFLFDNTTHLLSITSNGKERWIIDLNEKIIGAGPQDIPAIGPDGKVYVMTSSALYAIDTTGKVKWKFDIGQYATNPSISSDGIIYFGRRDGHIKAVTSQGNELWDIKSNDSFDAQLTIGPDSTIYIGGSHMYAIGKPMNMNGPTRISTKDITRTRVKHYYIVDYDTTHFNETRDVLRWALSTNASWLKIGKVDGVLEGTPTEGNIGNFWVNISVSNSTTVLDYHNFTLEVLKENHPPRNVTITSPKDGFSYSIDDAKNLSLEGSATDDDIGDVLNYTWYDNGEPLAYSRSMRFPFEPGTHQITLEVSDGELSSQTSITFKVVNPPRDDRQSAGGRTPLVAIIGISVMTIVILGFVAGSEAGKYGLVLSLAPLYSKTRKEAILDNFTRGMIYQYVWSNPGTYFNAIKKTLNLNNGTVIFHLDKLESECFIRSQRDGLKRRFYPMDTKAPAIPSIYEQILSTVRLNPGLSQRALSKALNLSPSTVNDYVHKMEAVGQLKLVKMGNVTKCYLGDEPNP